MNALGACSIMNDKGNYAQHPETKYNLDRASHDEMTGVLYFYSLKKDLFHIKQIKRLPYLKYIQFYYNLKAVQTQSKILTWIAGLIIWLGVGQLERAKNGRLDTDSELLALLKLETYKNLGIKQPWENLIMNSIKYNWGDNYIYSLISEMLWHDKNHPLYILAKGRLLDS